MLIADLVDPPDLDQASAWWIRADPADLAEARMWWAKAAEAGHGGARLKLDVLARIPAG